MTVSIFEAGIEPLLIGKVAGLGYSCGIEAMQRPEGTALEHESYAEAVLATRLIGATDWSILIYQPKCGRTRSKKYWRRVGPSDRGKSSFAPNSRRRNRHGIRR